MRARSLILALATTGAVAWFGAGTAAHKPITSPFTFYEDVLPITSVQCGACHEPEGIAPMSLLTPESATPWGESMRLELVAGHMPPWASVSPPERFRDARRLSARELNVLMTWAAGGTPPGDAPATAAPEVRRAGWPLGDPGATLALPATELSADVPRAAKEWVLPATAFTGRRLAGVDLLPGTPSVVRRARISTRRGGIERLVALWVPGDRPTLLPAGAGWTVEPDTELVVRIAYRKRWDREREPAKDQSTVGLYFAEGSGADASALAFRAGVDEGDGDTRRASAAVNEHVKVIALWPEPAAAGSSLRVESVNSGGMRVHVATLSPRPEWERRHWLKEPLDLAPGTRLEVKATWPAGAASLPAAGTALLGIDVLPR
jgi:hypothetical protein